MIDGRLAPPSLRTARLVLGPPTSADAEAIFSRYASDPEVTRFVGWPRHRTIADTKAFLAFSSSEWARAGVGPYLIRTRADDRLIGSTGLAIDAKLEAMTGYVLATDAWGNGFATEALQAMVELAHRLHQPHIYAFCHPLHRASQRVLEKCGFTRDQTRHTRMEFPNLEPGIPQDVFYYSRVLIEDTGGNDRSR